MKPGERFLAFMAFEAVDRPPLWEDHPWPSTLRRWRREALGPDGLPPQYAACENKITCCVDLWMLPRYPVEVLKDDGLSVVSRTDCGVLQRTWKSPDEMTMPEFLEYPVKGPADWKTLRARFDPSHPARFPPDWASRCERWREERPVLILQGPRSPSLFGFVRELLGAERALTAFYDEPAMVHEMMETMTELVIALLPRVTREAPLVALYFWEDMAYRGGSLISPALFREFMLPRYRRMCDAARACGVRQILVDSDGDIRELIPLWLEAGLTGVYPLEVAAGMDPRELRKRYGRSLVMHGGIDKRVLVRGREAIDAELRAKLPLAKQGGYIPHLDHSVPHDVPYEAFAWYFERKKELLGVLGGPA
jgi:hypothetical protein